MNFSYLEPEVAGGLGDDTVIDHSVSPPQVERLNYEFEVWLGDELLESFPCFIVTERLAAEIKHLNASGIRFADVKITRSPEFEELQPGESLPEFKWLQVFGTPGKDDFGIASDGRLVVSDTVLNRLKLYGLSHCDISDWTKD